MSNRKVALVTGATRGIGRAAVEALLSTGREVVACARDQARLDALRALYPDRVHIVRADLADAGEAVRVVDDALQMAGHLDELVCAAGIVHYAPLADVTERDLRAQLEVNFVAPFLMSQRAGLHMRERGHGSIVHVASTLGERPARDTSVYAASKAALLNTTRALAIELAPHVRVNAVAPGVVDTDMIRVPRERASSDPNAAKAALDTQLEALAAIHPLGRLGTPNEIAEAILFLLDASWITGSTLRIDGGLLAG